MGLMNWSERVDDGKDLLEITYFKNRQSLLVTLLVDNENTVVGSDPRGNRFLGHDVEDVVAKLWMESEGDPVTCRYTQAELMTGKRSVPRELAYA